MKIKATPTSSATVFTQGRKNPISRRATIPKRLAKKRLEKYSDLNKAIISAPQPSRAS